MTTRVLTDWDKLTDAYGAYLMLEKGLSDNTRESYIDDVNKLKKYVGKEPELLRDITLDSLHNLVAELHDLGIAPSSQARIISGLKSFFRFLIIEGYMARW